VLGSGGRSHEGAHTAPEQTLPCAQVCRAWAAQKAPRSWDATATYTHRHNTTHTNRHTQARWARRPMSHNHCTAGVAQGRVVAHPGCRTSPACMVMWRRPARTTICLHQMAACSTQVPCAHLLLAAASWPPHADLQLFIGSHCCRHGCCLAEPTWSRQAPYGDGSLLCESHARR
jgi:hypothetical protein